MKFTKTLVAVSVAVAAASANAAWVNPAQNLTVLSSSAAGNESRAPVLGFVHLSTITTSANQIDLGSQAVATSNTGAGSTITYEIFNYKSKSGEDLISLKNLSTGEDLGFFYRPSSANADLRKFSGTEVDVDLKSLSKGGQLSTQVGPTTTTGDELKVVNSEHLLYGYQGITQAAGSQLTGDLITPDGQQSPFSGTLPAGTADAANKYVQTGIIGNTGPKDTSGHATDVSKNIYGVSAKDGNNITVLTGNGIALGDLSNGGQLYDDGRVVTSNGVLVGSPTSSATLKSREYQVGGVTYVETFNDDKGNEVGSVFYRVNSNNELVLADATQAQQATAGVIPSRTGTASSTTGNYKTSWTHNTVTNKNVTYSEETTIAAANKTTVGVTNSNANGDNILTNTTAGAQVSKQSQSVVTGIIGNAEDGSNIYGLEVLKSNTSADSKSTSAKTTITADYVDSGDFRVNGVSIVDNIKTEVDDAVTIASEKIDKKVAEVDSRLTQFNSTADRLNSRINDIKETAYSGVAIALAAQQQVPNIGAGQFAVFGGAGHYEGETAGALGLVGVLADGRTSLSGALGVGGSGDVGGRLGVAYVFGGSK